MYFLGRRGLRMRLNTHHASGAGAEPQHGTSKASPRRRRDGDLDLALGINGR
jgi:hypothetical protein